MGRDLYSFFYYWKCEEREKSEVTFVNGEKIKVHLIVLNDNAPCWWGHGGREGAAPYTVGGSAIQ